jgi:soluble lytic murein transglycosylase-like protein
MNLTREFPHLRSGKFAPFAIFFLFLIANYTGVHFSPVMKSVSASPHDVEVIPSDIPTSGNLDLDWIIFRAGEREGVDPRFIHAVIWQESRYKIAAVSHAGAQGLMQLMPATAKRFGCADPNNMEQNVAAGTKYLAWLLKRFDGDVKLALAGYNAGEGAVDKYHGVPPYDETQNYVKKISADYGKTYHPIVSPDEARIVFNLNSSAESFTNATE